jgi:hypothetical protein
MIRNSLEKGVFQKFFNHHDAETLANAQNIFDHYFSQLYQNTEEVTRDVFVQHVQDTLDDVYFRSVLVD